MFEFEWTMHFVFWATVLESSPPHPYLKKAVVDWKRLHTQKEYGTFLSGKAKMFGTSSFRGKMQGGVLKVDKMETRYTFLLMSHVMESLPRKLICSRFRTDRKDFFWKM